MAGKSKLIFDKTCHCWPWSELGLAEHVPNPTDRPCVVWARGGGTIAERSNPRGLL